LAGTVSVEEAAFALKVSGQTVRRWASQGRIKGRKVVGPKGEEWRIWLEGETLPVEHSINTVEHDPGLLELALVLREMLNRQQQQGEQLIALTEANARLEMENAALRERVAATEAQQVLRMKRWWEVWKRD
jgi:excisionase family DNA binding protein